VGVRQVETAVFDDLQLLINEQVPLAFVRPERDEWKNLVSREDDVAVIGRTFEVIGQPPSDGF
jgi:hypothetical protein